MHDDNHNGNDSGWWFDCWLVKSYFLNVLKYILQHLDFDVLNIFSKNETKLKNKKIKIPKYRNPILNIKILYYHYVIPHVFEHLTSQYIVSNTPVLDLINFTQFNVPTLYMVINQVWKKWLKNNKNM